MGMYTEFQLNVKLDKNKLFVLDKLVLEHIINGEQINDLVFPNHPLFQADRFLWFAHGSSSYFSMITHSQFVFDENDQSYRLSIRSQFKNYSSVIEKFLNYITPFIEDYHDNFLGFYRYEEDDEPTLIFINETELNKDKISYMILKPNFET